MKQYNEFLHFVFIVNRFRTKGSQVPFDTFFFFFWTMNTSILVQDTVFHFLFFFFTFNVTVSTRIPVQACRGRDKSFDISTRQFTRALARCEEHKAYTQCTCRVFTIWAIRQWTWAVYAFYMSYYRAYIEPANNSRL